MLTRLAILAALAGCSYRPAFGDCQIVCESPAECPSELACSDGYCRVAGETGSCSDVIGDAMTAGDGQHSSRCSGTPQACETIVNGTACTGQDGCDHAPPTCTMTVDCTELLPSTECDGTPGCHTDVVMPYCKPIDDYCSGTTQPTCTAKQNCGFAGGCTGVPRACSSRTTEPICRAHAGCSWQ